MQLGFQLEGNLRIKAKTAVQAAQTIVDDELKKRGLRLNLQDVSQFVEEYSPRGAAWVLNFALDLFRPFSGGMGLRVARISDSQIEIVLPTRRHNLNSEGRIHEGALVTAAVEAAALLWKRHWNQGEVRFHLIEEQMQIHKADFQGNCRIRMELSETQRESVLGQLRFSNQSETHAIIFIYDDKDQLVGEIALKIKFVLIPALGSSVET